MHHTAIDITALISAVQTPHQTLQIAALLCRHILFGVAAGLKALPAPGAGPAQEASQHASESASTATQLAKVRWKRCLPAYCQLRC